MDNTSWEQKLHALTHILTSPTHAPPLHSQIFIAAQIPCYLDWDYPPLLCRRAASSAPPLMRWAFSQFIKRGRRWGLPETSWRCKCPYQLPPPLLLAKGVGAAEWGEEERRRYARSRFRRRRLGNDINPLIPILVPNILLLSLLFWAPVSLQD